MANIFVRSRPSSNWAASTAYALGDRRKATAACLGIHFEATTSGTSHATTEPTWNLTVGGTTNDGSVVWTTRGSANTWVASTAYVLGDRVVATTSATDTRRNYAYEATTAGTSGASEPAWVTTTPDTSTTTDNTATFTLRKCSTWNNAHITLESVGLAVSGTGMTVAGDTIYVGDEHLQTRASALLLVLPGVKTNPVNVICVNDTGDLSTPTTVASTAKVQTTGAFTITVSSTNQAVYYNGIQFQAGDGVNDASITLFGNSSFLHLENCLLELRGNNTSSRIGGFSSNGADAVLINTPVKFANASQGIAPGGPYSLTWKKTPSGVQGTAPTTLFPSATGNTSRIKIQGVDLAAVISNLISIANSGHQGTFLLSSCKLGAGVSVPTGTSQGLGTNVISLINCDSGATNTRLYHNEARGTIQQETTNVRTGGASDGTTPISWKMASLATLPRFSLPFASFPIVQWNNTTGSSKTLTIEIIHDSVTNLTDAEVWVEIEYLGTSGFPVSSFVNDAAASILATPADQTASSVAWTTTGLTNPNKQKLNASFTPQLKGPVSAIVYLAKPSKTIYVDPVGTIS